MFDPIKLREIARLKRFEQAQVAAATKTIPLTPEDTDRFIKDIEGHVETFAADGHEEVSYLLPEDLELAAVAHISSEFKIAHPFLMVITSYGDRTITVSWAKN